MNIVKLTYFPFENQKHNLPRKRQCKSMGYIVPRMTMQLYILPKPLRSFTGVLIMACHSQMSS